MGYLDDSVCNAKSLLNVLSTKHHLQHRLFNTMTSAIVVSAILQCFAQKTRNTENP